MSIRLLFTNRSLRDTVVSCDSMGIHYNIARSDNGAVTVKRWDSKSDSDILIGEFKLPFFHEEQIKIEEDGHWQPLSEFLTRTDGKFFIHDRAFKANNGATYVWKTRWDRWGQLIMTPNTEDDSNKEPLVAYRRMQLSKEQAYLDIHDTSVMEGLDYIILTFLIMEKKRRDRQKWRQRGISGGR